jgi:hypothetical protein
VGAITRRGVSLPPLAQRFLEILRDATRKLPFLASQ